MSSIRRSFWVTRTPQILLFILNANTYRWCMDTAGPRLFIEELRCHSVSRQLGSPQHRFLGIWAPFVPPIYSKLLRYNRGLVSLVQGVVAAPAARWIPGTDTSRSPLHGRVFNGDLRDQERSTILQENPYGVAKCGHQAQQACLCVYVLRQTVGTEHLTIHLSAQSWSFGL